MALRRGCRHEITSQLSHGPTVSLPYCCPHTIHQKSRPSAQPWFGSGGVRWRFGWEADGSSALPLQSWTPPPTCGSWTPRSTRCWCCGRGPALSSRATSSQQGPPGEGSPEPTTWDPLPPSTCSGTCSLAPSTPCTSWLLKATSRATERPESSPLVSEAHASSSSSLYPGLSSELVLKAPVVSWSSLLK